MTFLGLSGHQMCWMITTRKMMISSRLKSHSRCMAFGAGFQSIARTISHNQPSRHPPHLNASVRLATLRNITNRKGQESEVFVEDSAFSISYWTSRVLWKRAGINTLRCLVSCTLGDFSTMWFLQSQHPSLGIYMIMGISSKAT
jgi:hypothetical protein